MRYFAERKRRKLFRELRSVRRSEDDLLNAETRNKFDALLAQLRSERDPKQAVAEAQKSFAALSLPSNHGWLRNLLDLLLVVGAVAFGLRGIFFQPFRIPTSSMQPTLYGIHYRSDLPQLPGAVNAIFFGGRAARATVNLGGKLAPELNYTPGWSDETTFRIGNQRFALPGEPAKVIDYAGLDPDRSYAPGEKLCSGLLVLGDHLFVERFSIYLKEPARGDVLVFNTENLTNPDGRPLSETGGFYYIKRLAALPGDTVKLVDHQLWVKPRGAEKFFRIQELAPKFAKVYSGKGGYQGHNSEMPTVFPAPGEEYTVPENCYYMLGDNSKFSGDSRFFGAVPRKNLVGRAFFTFWPFSRRFGLVDRREPLELPTGESSYYTFPVMFKQ